MIRDRKAIKSMLCRLRDLGRIATRRGRVTAENIAAVRLAATVCHWP